MILQRLPERRNLWEFVASTLITSFPLVNQWHIHDHAFLKLDVRGIKVENGVGRLPQRTTQIDLTRNVFTETFALPVPGVRERYESQDAFNSGLVSKRLALDKFKGWTFSNGFTTNRKKFAVVACGVDVEKNRCKHLENGPGVSKHQDKVMNPLDDTTAFSVYNARQNLGRLG